jgi:hypothetical protein
MCDAPDPLAGKYKNCHNCVHWAVKSGLFEYERLEGSIKQHARCRVKNEYTSPEDSCDDWREIKKHELKCWPEYFQAIFGNEKLFEARLDDRDFQVGDVLQLREWNPETKSYTGANIFRKITYILRGALDIPSSALRPGYVVMSIEPMSFPIISETKERIPGHSEVR